MEEQPKEPQSPHQPPRKRRSPTRWILLGLLLAGGVGAYLYWPKNNSAASGSPKGGTTKKKGGGRGGDPNAPVPVVGARAIKGNIGVYYNGLGSVTPIYTVTVRSRVDGELITVHFKEGDIVEKGAPLMEIDPRPYQVQLTQAEGQMAKDQASLENARTDLSRYEGLLKLNAAPEQQVATQRSTVVQDEATIKSDQGQIDAARLNLTYTHITAPITGRVGLRLLDPGNIVHASDANGLVVITQIQPISALFTIAEDQLPVVMQKMRGRQPLNAEAWDHSMTHRIAMGTLTSVDNEIDPTTGTVRLRATFENNDYGLFPSQFVNIRLLVEERRGVVLLASAAIQRTSNATFVYVINADTSVAMRNITTGATEGDNTEITSGLAPGETVVMTGADRLQEGSKVRVEMPQDQGGNGRGGRKQ